MAEHLHAEHRNKNLRCPSTSTYFEVHVLWADESTIDHEIHTHVYVRLFVGNFGKDMHFFHTIYQHMYMHI